MGRRAGITSTLTAAAMLVLPSGASALTKVVYAGAPKALTQKLVKHLLGNQAKAIVKSYSPAILTFSIQTVTINQGDTVMWQGLATGFHTVDLADKSGLDLPFFVRSGTVTGVNDFAGNPFWFDGVEPSLGANPS